MGKDDSGLLRPRHLSGSRTVFAEMINGFECRGHGIVLSGTAPTTTTPRMIGEMAGEIRVRSFDAGIVRTSPA